MNRRRVLTRTIGVYILSAVFVQAGTYDWIPATTPNSWSNASNWTGSAPAGGPSGAGDVVTINTNITATSVINIFNTGDPGAAIKTIGVLNIGDTNGTNTFTLQTGTGSGSLTLNNSGGGAQINHLSTSSGSTISAPLAINDAGGLVISNASTAGIFTLSGIISSAQPASIRINTAATTSNNSVSLSGINTFVAPVSVDANSKLTITRDASLGNASNSLTLGAGSTLFLSGSMGVHSLRSVNVSGGVTLDGTSLSAINGAITGSDGLTVLNDLLLNGENNYGTTTTINGSGMLGFSSHANIGGASSTIVLGNAGGGFVIRGTEVTNLSSHTFTAGSGFGGLTIGILDPGNSFTWDKSFNRSLNSATASAFTKTGAGALTVTTPQLWTNSSSSGLATAINGGVLKVDYTAGGSLAPSQNRVGFGGGTLYLLGKGTSATNQTLGNVKLNAGGGTLVVDNQGGTSATTLTLGNFTSLATANGSSLNIRTINPGTGGAVVTTTQLNDATGIIGAGRVIFNGSDFATNSTNTSGAPIAGYTGYTVGLPATGADSATNYSQTGSASVTLSETANSLKLTTSGTGQSLAVAAGETLTLNNGGLLFTGAHDYSIMGGTLKSNTATNSDLIVHQYGSGTLTIGSVIGNGIGASTLTKAGSGTLILTSANTYTGQTYINDGVLSISNNNQLGSGTAQVNLNGTLKTTATLTINRTVALGGNGGAFDVANGTTTTVSGALSGLSGSLALSNSDGGNGTLLLTAGNTFGGGITINQGILRVGHASALNPGGTNTLSFGNGTTARLQMNGFNGEVAGLSSNSTNAVVENASSTANVTLTVNTGADNTFRGVIQDGTGTRSLSLVKGGRGTLTVTGTNTYTGSTTINGGTFLVSGTGSINGTSGVTIGKGEFKYNSSTTYTGGAIVVNSGGKVSGSGNLGSTTLGGSGSIDPGNSPGILTAGAVDPSGGLDYNFEFTLANTAPLWSNASASGNDVLRLTNATTPFAASLGAGNVIGIYLSSLSNGDVFTGGFYTDKNASFLSQISGATLNYYLANPSGAISYNGTNYDLYTGPFTFEIASVATSADFGGGTVNGFSMQLTAVPEPGSLVLLSAGIGLIMVLRRGRGPGQTGLGEHRS